MEIIYLSSLRPVFVCIILIYRIFECVCVCVVGWGGGGGDHSIPFTYTILCSNFASPHLELFAGRHLAKICYNLV
jgi:hypothetical protein